MISRKLLTTDEYLEIALRRIWYILIPLVLSMAVGVIYVTFCPRTYLASTMIMVTPQKVPLDYVKPTVSLPIEQRLHSITQQIMSRTQLEKVIAEFKLYAEESKALASEEVIELMRKDIRIKVGGKEGYFTLSYVGKDPVVVTNVTNRLASLFIEENLRLREQQAQGTTEFLNQELNASKVKLEEQEKIITEYKQQHIYELPNRTESNMGMLNQLRQDHQRVSVALNSAQERKFVVQKQIAEIQKQTALIKSVDTSPPSREAANQDGQPQNTQPGSVNAPAGLAGQLRELRTKYTEKHPDVLLIQKKIRDSEQAAANAEKGSSLKEDFDPQVEFTKEMKGQLAVTENEIKNLQKEESKIRASIAINESRVQNAPLRELTIANLSRDYDISKEHYRRLLDKSEQAQQAENLEKRQKGEQFRLIDPGRVPEKPIKPNIPMVLLTCLFLGLFSGIGLVIFKEYMDRSFRDARDMEATLGIKVLANIPRFLPKTG